jgi:hypothetical protein
MNILLCKMKPESVLRVEVTLTIVADTFSAQGCLRLISSVERRLMFVSSSDRDPGFAI